MNVNKILKQRLAGFIAAFLVLGSFCSGLLTASPVHAGAVSMNAPMKVDHEAQMICCDNRGTPTHTAAILHDPAPLFAKIKIQKSVMLAEAAVGLSPSKQSYKSALLKAAPPPAPRWPTPKRE